MNTIGPVEIIALILAIALFIWGMVSLGTPRDDDDDWDEYIGGEM